MLASALSLALLAPCARAATGLYVALSAEQAGYLQIPVPRGFVEDFQAGDRVLRAKGAAIVFHTTLPRPMGPSELDQRAELLADGIRRLRLNLGERCGLGKVKRLRLADGWRACYEELVCRRDAVSDSIAAAVSTPGVALDVQASGVSLATLKAVLGGLRLVRLSRQGPILGAAPIPRD